MSGDSVRGGLPRVSVANQRLASSTERRATSRISQKFAQSPCQEAGIPTLNHESGFTFFDEIWNRADVRGNDWQAVGKCLQEHESEGLHVCRQTENGG